MIFWSSSRAPPGVAAEPQGTLAQQRLRMGRPCQPRALLGDKSNSGCAMWDGAALDTEQVHMLHCRQQGSDSEWGSCHWESGSCWLPCHTPWGAPGRHLSWGRGRQGSWKLTRLLFASLLPGVATCVDKYY